MAHQQTGQPAQPNLDPSLGPPHGGVPCAGHHVPHPGHVPRPPRRRGPAHGRSDGKGGRRRPPRGRRVRHRRRSRATPTLGPTALRAKRSGLWRSGRGRGRGGGRHPRRRAAVVFLGYGDSGSGPVHGHLADGAFSARGRRRGRRARWPTCCVRSGPTCSPCTTVSAATATPTTSRSTVSALRAAELAGTPVVLEATVSRELLQAGAELAPPSATSFGADFRPESLRRLVPPRGRDHHGGRRLGPARPQATRPWRPTPAKPRARRLGHDAEPGCVRLAARRLLPPSPSARSGSSVAARPVSGLDHDIFVGLP